MPHNVTISFEALQALIVASAEAVGTLRSLGKNPALSAGQQQTVLNASHRLDQATGTLVGEVDDSNIASSSALCPAPTL